MEFAFYICGLIAILATLRVITHTNPVHALLYLIISLLAISGVFFSLGAHFAGALEIIVYAGAIMVLFVFVVMMLNLGGTVVEQERKWLKPAGVDRPGTAVCGPAGGDRLRHSGRQRSGYRRDGDWRESGGYHALWPIRSGGGTGLNAAAGRSGCGLPPGPRREGRRGAEQPHR